MPEAPEVQTVLSTLEHQIKGIPIKQAWFFYEKLVGNMDSQEFAQKLQGQSIERFYRIGKFLGFETQNYDWICHLRMEGKFYLFQAYPDPKDKHIHAIFELEDERYICYHDTRKFGRMYLYPKTEHKADLPCLKNIGTDYTKATSEMFYKKIHKSKKEIKNALLDQSIIAGIGNIYADEILFSAKIDPRTPAHRLNEKDCDTILKETKRILTEATEAGGTTIRSYTSSLGISGRFQLKLKVHQQEGKNCPRCGAKIEKIKVGSRSTYLCPICQTKK